MPRKGEEEGWPAKGAKRKKDARKEVRLSGRKKTLSPQDPIFRSRGRRLDRTFKLWCAPSPGNRNSVTLSSTSCRKLGPKWFAHPRCQGLAIFAVDFNLASCELNIQKIAIAESRCVPNRKVQFANSGTMRTEQSPENRGTNCNVFLGCRQGIATFSKFDKTATFSGC